MIDTRDVVVGAIGLVAGAAAGAYGFKKYQEYRAAHPMTPAATTPAVTAPTHAGAGYLPAGQAAYYPAGLVQAHSHAHG